MSTSEFYYHIDWKVVLTNRNLSGTAERQIEKNKKDVTS